MVPKIHAKGSSFVGLGKYVLHDKGGAETSERVEWTQTRNLATQDPELAFRLMAATAMDAERLKANAGVKNTGRKSDKSVLHLTLSWHPDETEGLTKDEMMRAANGAIRALGADDRQALIVSHNDEEQPHLHLVINRVSQDDGRMLSSSKEKLRLSRFALEYERERGEILCENRALNWEARNRGQYVRGEKDIPRHIYEQHLANDNRPGGAEHHRKQRAEDKEIGARQRRIRDRLSADWTKLESGHAARRTQILSRRKIDSLRARSAIEAEYRADRFGPLDRKQRAELGDFQRDEQRALGKIKNRFKAIDLKSLVGSMKRERSVGPLFDAVSSSEAGLARLKLQHERQKASIRGEERREIRSAIQKIWASARAELAEASKAYESERAALAFKCAGESAKMRAEWRQRAAERANHAQPEQRRNQVMKQVLDRKARERDRNSDDRER